jgi:hypothetical protein
MSVAHPPIPILDVLKDVIDQVRLDARLSEALDRYAPGDPLAANVAVRWLSRKRAYEVTLKFDAEHLQSHEPLRNSREADAVDGPTALAGGDGAIEQT